MVLLQAHPRARLVFFTLAGCLIGWLVVGTLAAIAFDFLLFGIGFGGIELSNDVHLAVLGTIVIACLIGGGVVGNQVGHRPFRAKAAASREDLRRETHASSENTMAGGSVPSANPATGTDDVPGMRKPGTYNWDGQSWTAASPSAAKTAGSGAWLLTGILLILLGCALAGASAYVMSTDLQWNIQEEAYSELNYDWIPGIVAGGLVVVAGLFPILVAAVAKGTAIGIRSGRGV